MLLVGELINSSRPAVAEMLRSKDGEGIGRLVRAQADHGAGCIDVNAGAFLSEEKSHLQWLVQTVQGAVPLPCCIDSPDPAAIEAAVRVHRGGAPLINSISLEKDRFNPLLSLVAGTDWKIVALCTSDEGMPRTAERRLAVAGKLIDALVGKGVAAENIYVDCLVQPVATDASQAAVFLQTVSRLKASFAGVNTICGLSNISFGLPQRSLINRTFAAMAISAGLDAAIANPLDRELMAAIIAARTLAGQDPYCLEYLTAFRQHRFGPAQGDRT